MVTDASIAQCLLRYGFIFQNQSRCQKLCGHELRERKEQEENSWLTYSHFKPSQPSLSSPLSFKTKSFFPLKSIPFTLHLMLFHASFSVGFCIIYLWVFIRSWTRVNLSWGWSLCILLLFALLPPTTVLYTWISAVYLLNEERIDGWKLKKKRNKQKTKWDRKSRRVENDLKGSKKKNNQKTFLFELILET